MNCDEYDSVAKPMQATINRHLERIATLEAALAEREDKYITLTMERDRLAVSKIDFLQQWMRTPNPMLGGAIPMDMMYQGMGRRVAQFIDSAYQSETEVYVDRHHGGTTVEERETLVKPRMEYTGKYSDGTSRIEPVCNRGTANCIYGESTHAVCMGIGTTSKIGEKP